MQLESKMKAMMLLALNGDEKTYAALLTQLSLWARPRATRVFYRYGAHTQDLEDVVQEMLLAVHLKKHTWQVNEAFMPWVYAILRYKIIDNLRKRRIMADFPIEEIAETLEEEATPPDASAQIKPMLTKLPQQQQQIVTAILEEGLSQEEVAEKLQLNAGTVRVNLHRAVKTLAHIFKDKEA